MTVRRARLWHVPKLVQILWSGTRSQSPTTRRRSDDIWLMVKLCWRRQITLVSAGGKVRAFLARDGARVHALYTEPRWRNHGAGATLLGSAQDTTARLELWCAQSNVGARRFYAANGFYEAAETAGEGNDDGLPDVLMKWERQHA